MARSSVRVEVHSDALRTFLSTNPELKAMMERKTEAIAAAAGGSPDFEPSVRAVGGSSKLGRLMGYVTTATYDGRRAEAETRALTRALDAGRNA